MADYSGLPAPSDVFAEIEKEKQERQQKSLDDLPAPSDVFGGEARFRVAPRRPVIGVADELGRGVRQGVQQAKGLLTGGVPALAGDALKGFGLEELGEEIGDLGRKNYEEAMAEAAKLGPSVQSLTDVGDAGDLLRFALGSAGQMLPNVATVLAGGGIGGAAAKEGLKRKMKSKLRDGIEAQLGRPITNREVNKFAKDLFKRDDVRKTLAKKAAKGRKVGAYGTSMGMGTGEVQGELIEGDIENPAVALAGGVAVGLLDMFGIEKLLEKAMPGADAKLAKGFVKDILVGMGQQGAIEAPTEALQEAIVLASRAYADPSVDLDFTDKETVTRLADAGAAGFFGGGAMGGAARGGARIADAMTDKDLIGRIANRFDAWSKAGQDKLRAFQSAQPTMQEPDAGEGVVRNQEELPEERMERLHRARVLREQMAPETRGDAEDTMRREILEYTDTDDGRAYLQSVGISRDSVHNMIPDLVGDDLRTSYEQIVVGNPSLSARRRHRDRVLREQMAPETREDAEDTMRREILEYMDTDDGRAYLKSVEISRDSVHNTIPDLIGRDLRTLYEQIVVGNPRTATELRNIDSDEIGSLMESTWATAQSDPALVDQGIMAALEPDAVGLSQDPNAIWWGTRRNGKPYKNQKGGVEKRRAEMAQKHGLPEEAFAIVPHEGGYVVHLTNKGDLNKGLAKFNEQFALARRNAGRERRKDVNRQIQIRDPEGNAVKLDLPTLIHGGYGLLDEGAKTSLTNNESRLAAMMQAFSELVDRGYKFPKEEAFIQGLQNKIVTEFADQKQTFAEAVESADMLIKPFTLHKRDRDATETSKTFGKKRTTKLERAEDIINRAERGEWVHPIKVDKAESDYVAAQDAIEDRQMAREEDQSPPVFDRSQMESELRDGRQTWSDPEGAYQFRETEEAQNRRSAPRPSPKGRRQRRRTPADNQVVKKKVGGNTTMRMGRYHRNSDFGNQVAEVARVVDLTLKELGFDIPLTIVDDAGLAWMEDKVSKRKGSIANQHAAILRRASQDAYSGAMYGRMMGQGKMFVIYLSDRMIQDTGQPRGDGKVNVYATLMHEVGHAIQAAYYDRLSPKMKERLRFEFQKTVKQEQSLNAKDEQAAFDEWMADQFVAYTNERYFSAQAQTGKANMVTAFFSRVADTIRKLYDRLSRAYPLNESYTEFVRGVAQVMAGKPDNVGHNDYAQDLITNGINGFNFFSSGVESDQANLNALPSGVNTNSWRNILNSLRRNQRVMKLPKMLATTLMHYHSLWTGSLDSALRRMPYDAAKILANVFGDIPGQRKNHANYHNLLQRNLKTYQYRATKIIENTPEARMPELLKILQRLDGDPNATISAEEKRTHPEIPKLRNLFDDLHEYMKRAGLPVGKVANYFPRVYDKASMQNSRAENLIRDHLESNYNLSEEEAEQVYYNMAFGREYSFNVFPDPLEMEKPVQDFLNQRTKFARDPFFDDYTQSDLRSILFGYIGDVTKRAEFNRFLGQDSRRLEPGESWKPTKKYEALLNRARAQGANQEDLAYMRKAVDANLGRLGRSLPEDARKLMAGMVGYQNLRTLLFSAFASTGDMAGPAIRSNDTLRALRILRKQYREIADKNSDHNKMARVFGIVQDTLDDHIATEYLEHNYMPPAMRKINDKFFQFTGLHSLTNFTRSYALAVGKDFIENSASEVQLAELGLERRDVDNWVRNGRQVYGVDNSNREADRKVADALVKFVNQAVLKPNPSQRPMNASDPHYMLVYHLKTFMYAFQKTFGARMAHNIREAQTPAEYVAALTPMMLLLGMTAAGWELREAIQYAGSDRPPRSDSYNAVEYGFELAQRSGLLGPAQMAVDFNDAKYYGQEGLVGLSGPAVGQLTDLLSKPASTTVPKAIPVVAQVPVLRDTLREGVNTLDNKIDGN